MLKFDRSNSEGLWWGIGLNGDSNSTFRIVLAMRIIVGSVGTRQVLYESGFRNFGSKSRITFTQLPSGKLEIYYSDFNDTTGKYTETTNTAFQANQEVSLVVQIGGEVGASGASTGGNTPMKVWVNDVREIDKDIDAEGSYFNNDDFIVMGGTYYTSGTVTDEFDDHFDGWIDFFQYGIQYDSTIGNLHDLTDAEAARIGNGEPIPSVVPALSKDANYCFMESTSPLLFGADYRPPRIGSVDRSFGSGSGVFPDVNEPSVETDPTRLFDLPTQAATNDWGDALAFDANTTSNTLTLSKTDRARIMGLAATPTEQIEQAAVKGVSQSVDIVDAGLSFDEQDYIQLWQHKPGAFTGLNILAYPASGGKASTIGGASLGVRGGTTIAEQIKLFSGSATLDADGTSVNHSDFTGVRIGAGRVEHGLIAIAGYIDTSTTTDDRRYFVAVADWADIKPTGLLDGQFEIIYLARANTLSQDSLTNGQNFVLDFALIVDSLTPGDASTLTIQSSDYRAPADTSEEGAVVVMAQYSWDTTIADRWNKDGVEEIFAQYGQPMDGSPSQRTWNRIGRHTHTACAYMGGDGHIRVVSIEGDGANAGWGLWKRDASGGIDGLGSWSEEGYLTGLGPLRGNQGTGVARIGPRTWALGGDESNAIVHTFTLPATPVVNADGSIAAGISTDIDRTLISQADWNIGNFNNFRTTAANASIFNPVFAAIAGQDGQTKDGTGNNRVISAYHHAVIVPVSGYPALAHPAAVAAPVIHPDGVWMDHQRPDSNDFADGNDAEHKKTLVKTRMPRSVVTQPIKCGGGNTDLTPPLSRYTLYDGNGVADRIGPNSHDAAIISGGASENGGVFDQAAINSAPFSGPVVGIQYSSDVDETSDVFADTTRSATVSDPVDVDIYATATDPTGPIIVKSWTRHGDIAGRIQLGGTLRASVPTLPDAWTPAYSIIDDAGSGTYPVGYALGTVDVRNDGFEDQYLFNGAQLYWGIESARVGAAMVGDPVEITGYTMATNGAASIWGSIPVGEYDSSVLARLGEDQKILTIKVNGSDDIEIGLRATYKDLDSTTGDTTVNDLTSESSVIYVKQGATEQTSPIVHHFLGGFPVQIIWMKDGTDLTVVTGVGGERGTMTLAGYSGTIQASDNMKAWNMLLADARVKEDATGMTIDETDLASTAALAAAEPMLFEPRARDRGRER